MINDLPARRPRGFAHAALLPALALAALLSTAAQAAAQHPPGHRSGHRVEVGGERPAGTTTISPRSGAPGTVLSVEARALPPETRVQIMIGALRSGFEVVAVAVSDGEGRLSGGALPVSVPDWVETDRPYAVIITDLGYNPLAVADMFHATDAAGMVERQGRIEEVTPCPSLTNDAGELYFLTGGTAGMQLGDQVIVQGRLVDTEVCGKATTIEVTQVRPAPAPVSAAAKQPGGTR